MNKVKTFISFQPSHVGHENTISQKLVFNLASHVESRILVFIINYEISFVLVRDEQCSDYDF